MADPRARGEPMLGLGQLRLRIVREIPRLLSDAGVDPGTVLQRAGLPSLDFEHDAIGLSRLGRLLDHCAAAANCAHFGLRLGGLLDLDAFGEVGHDMLAAPTVGDALRGFVLAHHLSNTGTVPMLLPNVRGRATFAYSVYAHGVEGIGQIVDCAVARGVQIMRRLCGYAWRPLRIDIAHGMPADLLPYHAALDHDLRFDAPLTAIVFDSAWLRRPVVGADPVQAGTAQRGPGAPPEPLAARLRRALVPMVYTGTASAPRAARMFGLHPRAFERRLEAEQTSFRALFNEARLEIARQLLEHTELKLTAIAATLHYADLTAFSRGFRNSTGLAPRDWRDLRRRRVATPCR